MYVDDVLDLSETIESTQDLQRQLSEVLGMAAFRLRKWCSNEPLVVVSVPERDRLTVIEIHKEKPQKTKTLGLTWEAAKDVFFFEVKQPDMSVNPTKRSVLVL